MTNREYHRIQGMYQDKIMYYSVHGWVQKYSQRGLYTKTGARIAVRDLTIRYRYLDSQDHVTDIEILPELEKVR